MASSVGFISFGDAYWSFNLGDTIFQLATEVIHAQFLAPQESPRGVLVLQAVDERSSHTDVYCNDDWPRGLSC